MLTIDDLPDDVLLEIFDFHVRGYQNLDSDEANFCTPYTKWKAELWQLLVHVCRRWRCLVFESPRRLNLQIFCSPGIFARKSLDIWPALPLVIQGDRSETLLDNVITGLEHGLHSDRIRQIDIYYLVDYPASKINELWTAMQVPLPELARLYLSFGYFLFGYGPHLPHSFLGGSAPRLRYLYLDALPFPELPKLLLSATHLVHLYLRHIPFSGYILPEEMATCLPSSLEALQLQFDSFQAYSGLKNRRLFPPTHSALPNLTNFSFRGENEYLDEFVARIDAPALYQLSTTFFNDIDFNTSESKSKQFISRTSILGVYEGAHLIFGSDRVQARFHQSEIYNQRMVEVDIISEVSDRQLSTLTRVGTLSFRPLLTTENLFIDGIPTSPLVWEDDIETTKWLELLLPFTVVKNLYLSRPISPRIALALQELTGGRTTEVLPALRNVFLEGFQSSEPVYEGIAQFIIARQHTDHPVAIIYLG